MSTVSVSLTGTANADAILSSSATYLTARSGNSQGLMGITDARVGQRSSGGIFSCYETFVEFDTSYIPANVTVVSATFKMYLRFDDSGTNFIAQARLHDYGTSVTTGDYIAGASLSGDTLLATFDTSTVVGAGYITFAEVALAANINKGGFTRIAISSDRESAGTSPAVPGDEYLTFYAYDPTNPPTLDIVFAPIFGTNRGTGGTTGTTTHVITGDATIHVSAGNLGVLTIALDNAGSAGSTAAAPTSSTDSVGNVWTRRQDGIYDNGSASAGVEVAIYTGAITADFTTGSTLTLTWIGGVTVTAKSWAMHEIDAEFGYTPAYLSGGAGTGATSGAPTITTGSITSGDMVIGVGGLEAADSWTGDADTTSGTWSTHQHAASGTGTTGMAVTAQRKVVTATAAQTYNPTCTSADTCLAWISVQATPQLRVSPSIINLRQSMNRSTL